MNSPLIVLLIIALVTSIVLSIIGYVQNAIKYVAIAIILTDVIMVLLATGQLR